MQPLTLTPELRIAMQREWGKESFADFVRFAWHIVEPAVPLVWGKHMDAICEHLQAVSERKITRLIINVPPGHAKSTIVSVMWPAWQWLRQPAWRGIFASYDDRLSVRDSIKTRTLIESDWYRLVFNPLWELRGDQNKKDEFVNTASGFRKAVSVGSGTTGHRGDAVVIDDPLKAEESPSLAKLESVIAWWRFQMSSRFNDQKTGQRVLIMQRLHERDLAGYLLESEGSKWEHLCLPSLFDSRHRSSTSIGWEDWREEDGELLFPEKFDEETVEEARTDLGEYGFASQHQQRPAPAGGGILKAWHFNFWMEHRQPFFESLDGEGNRVKHIQGLLPDEPWELFVHSWDMSFKDKNSNDPVAGGVWARYKGNFYLLDLVYGKMSFTKSKAAVQKLVDTAAEQWQAHDGILVEDRANGSAIMDELRDSVSPLVEVQPLGGKEARAHACAPTLEAGKIWLPHPNEKPWVRAYLDEVAKFPKGAHDDRVDQMTQAIAYLKNPTEKKSGGFGFSVVGRRM